MTLTQIIVFLSTSIFLTQAQSVSSVHPTTTTASATTTITTAIITTPTGTPGGANTVRPCGSTPKKIKLDIIFALDSSQAVGSQNYQSIKEHLAGVIRLITVNQNGVGSRVGLIYYADRAHQFRSLSSFNTTEEAAQALLQMPYLNIIKLDMNAALLAAEQMFPRSGHANRKQVLVLSSTGCTNCKGNELKAECDTIGAEQEHTCGTAAALKRSGITIMTILLKPNVALPKISLATPCFAFHNDASLTRNLVLGWMSTYIILCSKNPASAQTVMFWPRMSFQSATRDLQDYCDYPKVNCYCNNHSYTQFTNPHNKCEKYAECVFLQRTSDTWVNAQTTCKQQGAGGTGGGSGYLATEFSSDKEAFLKNIAISANVHAFWIGLNDMAQSGTYMWDQGAGSPIPALPGDFTYWGPGQPNDANGHCISQSKKVGFQLFWENRKCNDIFSSDGNLDFFCQQNACETDNQCG